LAYEDANDFPFGPIRVVKDGSQKFAHSVYPKYGKMNTEELAFARALDSNGVTWHRNLSSGGFCIPLLTPGNTANFYPDFLAWKGNKVFALDTKGKHLITDALARKMFDIYEDGVVRLHVRFIVKGRQEAIGARTTDRHGFTVWRTRLNAPKAFYVDSIEKAVTECLK
jgi:type III restriction enzyme